MARSRRKRRTQSAAANAVTSGNSAHKSIERNEKLYLMTLGQVWGDYKFLLLGMFGILLYSYWPTFVWIEEAWRNEPDYSHGYLVPVLALMLCWHRRDTFPGIRAKLSPWGLSLIILAILMRLVGRLVYADFLDGWSIVPMIAGIAWFLMGPRAMKWALPAVVFLILMIPMPYRAETLLSYKLQGVATELSTISLRVFGQPAVSEGHTIWLGEDQLLVEQACSGLRIFIGVAALAYFWACMVTRIWLDRMILICAVIPTALFVNAVRITVTGLMYQSVTDPGMRHTVHDMTGYLMIPFAFGLLWLIKVYWENLYRPLDRMSAKDFVRMPKSQPIVNQ